jgi:hypothetical protein
MNGLEESAASIFRKGGGMFFRNVAAHLRDYFYSVCMANNFFCPALTSSLYTLLFLLQDINHKTNNMKAY